MRRIRSLAASGHAAAAPPIRLMNSRLLIRSPCRPVRAAYREWREPASVDFPANCGWRSIVAMMAGVAAEVVMLGDYDRIGCRYDVVSVQARLARCGYDADTLS